MNNKILIKLDVDDLPRTCKRSLGDDVVVDASHFSPLVVIQFLNLLFAIMYMADMTYLQHEKTTHEAYTFTGCASNSASLVSV